MKLKNPHLFLMILCCATMFVVLLFLPKILKGNFLAFLILLLCPLSHLLMMKFMGHGENKHRYEGTDMLRNNPLKTNHKTHQEHFHKNCCY